MRKTNKQIKNNANKFTVGMPMVFLESIYKPSCIPRCEKRPMRLGPTAPRWRTFANYLDEDFMGRMKAVTRKSSGGGLWKTIDALLAKYIRGVFLRWRATEDNPLL